MIHAHATAYSTACEAVTFAMLADSETASVVRALGDLDSSAAVAALLADPATSGPAEILLAEALADADPVVALCVEVGLDARSAVALVAQGDALLADREAEAEALRRRAAFHLLPGDLV